MSSENSKDGDKDRALGERLKRATERSERLAARHRQLAEEMAKLAGNETNPGGGIIPQSESDRRRKKK